MAPKYIQALIDTIEFYESFMEHIEKYTSKPVSTLLIGHAQSHIEYCLFKLFGST